MRLLPSLVAAGLAATVLAAPASARAADDTWSVPSSATVTVKGHGFGHGRGMSQHGAEGAARQGLGHREILEFYYRGTSWGSARGRVTVQVSADTTDDVVVVARPGLTVTDLGTGERTALPDNGASRWRIATPATGALRVSYRTTRWRRWRDLAGEGAFYAGGDPVTLVTPAGERAYRGRLRAALVPGGVDTVNDVTLESYLRGVVPLEVPATWSSAAVRAQAVAARTYAAYERRNPRSSAFQLYDTTASQVYGGVAAEHPASDAAVAATRGQVLTAEGRPAFTQFSSSSGGWTAAGSAPYLAAVEDPYDGWSGNSVHSWTTRVDDVRLERAWPVVGDLERIAVLSRDGNGDWGGRVRTLRLTGSDGAVTVSGDTFRSALGLRSTYLTFAVTAR